ncbi:MAG: CPBP family intramembrane metalloprotease [Ruminococcus sp.]|nr:CPBP family intramembrane metalloprotease [Ruminococcus sp.]
MSSTNEYLIDVASDSKYSGQNEEYKAAFTKWRTKENNRFGYKFVKDTREHTYAFGEGFENDLASDSERNSLKYCSCLIGGTMLISATIRLCQVLYDNSAGHLLAGSSIEVYGNTRATDELSTIVLSVFKPFSLIVCILILLMFTRLPRKVFLPQGKSLPKRITFSIYGVVAGFAVACYVISVLFRIIFGTQFMSVPGGFVWCDNMGLNIHCFGMQYILTPVLHAVLMNGIILQLLRQFGDSTAIILTAAVESIMAINLTNIGTHFVMGLIVAMATIKTGSVMSAMICRILINLIFFALKLLDTSLPSVEDEFYMMLACIVMLAIGLFSLGRLISFSDYSVNIKSVDTQLTFSDKTRTFVTTMPTMSWLAASMIVWLYIMAA